MKKGWPNMKGKEMMWFPIWGVASVSIAYGPIVKRQKPVRRKAKK